MTYASLVQRGGNKIQWQRVQGGVSDSSISAKSGPYEQVTFINGTHSYSRGRRSFVLFLESCFNQFRAFLHVACTTAAFFSAGSWETPIYMSRERSTMSIVRVPGIRSQSFRMGQEVFDLSREFPLSL